MDKDFIYGMKVSLDNEFGVVINDKLKLIFVSLKTKCKIV